MSFREISHIGFGTYSAEEVIRTSVAKIFVQKFGGENSVYDERMGTLDLNKTCVSCGLPSVDCPGHHGHIELNYPILHPMYPRTIVNYLKCICNKCNKLLISKENLELDGILKYTKEHRFEKIVEKMEKVEMCIHCKNPKSKVIYISKENAIYLSYKKTKVQLTDEDVKKIFDNVDDETVKTIGFNPTIIHPKDLVLTVLPVLPPISRPYVIADEITCDDDLTLQYGEIIKANNNLEDKNSNETKFLKNIQTLKFRIKTLFNNSQGKCRHSSGRALKAIKERISGKEGIIRSNLMGKRVDQSGRTVVGPDPTVRVDELVVPRHMADILTMPITVNQYNIDLVNKKISDGKVSKVIKKNGATVNVAIITNKIGTKLKDFDIIKRGDTEIVVQNASNFKVKQGDKIRKDTDEGSFTWEEVILPTKKPYSVEIGDVVERYLENGDIVLFNRQPTLHAGSMIAKRVVIREGKTLRFNLASTKTFNCDFDGKLYCR